MSKFLSRVGAGASAGSAFGPWGAIGGGIIGGVSSLFGGKSDEEKALEERNRKIEEYRRWIMMNSPIEAQNTVDAMNAKLANLQGMQDMASKFTGGAAKANLHPDLSGRVKFAQDQADQALGMPSGTAAMAAKDPKLAEEIRRNGAWWVKR